MTRATTMLLAYAVGACAAPYCVSTPLLAQASTPTPSRVLVDAAVRTAASGHKAVLVRFGASWCLPCREFSAFLADTGVGPIMAAHYVIVSLVTQEAPANTSLENPGSAEMMAALGGARSGLPFFVVLDSVGRKIADSNVMPDGSNVGFPGRPEEVAFFDYFLARTAPRITGAERAQIRAYLHRIVVR
jgi:thiol:disulfide interchange protein